MGRIDPGDEFAEHVHPLSELRILPVIVLVMVLDNERDSRPRRVRKAGLDALGRVANPVAARYLRAALAGKYAAVFRPQCRRHFDPMLFRVDLSPAKLRIGMSEIRRA